MEQLSLFDEADNAPGGAAGDIVVYTDGGCSGNPGAGGWGCVIIDETAAACGKAPKEQSFSGGEKCTTNNRMELTAVISALECLKEPCEVDLYSDSKYVIDALEKDWAVSWKKKGWIKSDKKPALNPDLWEKLLLLISQHEMHYHWVKGHAENEYNNRCDALAVAERDKWN
jgi:ribonuclease HI